MKFLLGVLLTAGIGYVTQLYFPWWSVVIVAFVVGIVIGLKGIPSFLYGFLGVGLLWGIYAMIINSNNHGILARQVGEILQGINEVGLILLTGLLGGIIGGLGAMTGGLGRQIFKKRS